MPGIKELKNKIKSVKSTRKITKAMQMVAAAKMRKAQMAAINSRTYADLAWDLIDNVAKQGSFSNPLAVSYPDAKKIGIIAISSNKGLVGSLNVNLVNSITKAHPGILNSVQQTELIYEVITYGKKITQAVSRLKGNLIADFKKPERSQEAQDIYPIAEMIIKLYASGEYSKIYLAYNKFVSTLIQQPELKLLLPFNENLRNSIENEEDEYDIADAKYIFEPDPKTVLDHLLPRIIESQIYEAVLESDASEHSSRMIMMKNATEAAGDLISDYTLTYNQLRQGKITTELAEITAGKIALE